jgi:hypothetical protein
LDIKNATQLADLGGMNDASKSELKRVVKDLEDLIFPKPEHEDASRFRPDELRLNRPDDGTSSRRDAVGVGSIGGKAKAAWAELDVDSGQGRDDDLRNKKSMLSAALTEVLGALVVPLAIRAMVRKPIKLFGAPMQVSKDKVGFSRLKKVDEGKFRPALLKTDKAENSLDTVRKVWGKVYYEELTDDVKKLVVDTPMKTKLGQGMNSDLLKTLFENSKSTDPARAGDREKLVGILNEAFTALQDQGETTVALHNLENASKQLQTVFELEVNLMALVDLKIRMDVEKTEGSLPEGTLLSKNSADNSSRSAQHFRPTKR